MRNPRLREREQALAAGYDWHLAKPVEPDELIATAANAVLRGTHGANRKARPT